MESDSLQYLTDLLHYATRKNLSAASLFLIESLMKKRSEMDFKSARSIIRSICALKVDDVRHRSLLHHALDLMVESQSNCTYQDYDILISKMIPKYLARNYYFYHEEFMNAAINFVIKNNCGFNESVWMLRKATKFVSTPYYW